MEEFLWTEKYRPRSLSECILPSAVEKTFRSYLEKGDLPHLILHGSSGAGKTTVAKAVLEDLKRDVLVINGSLNLNMDALRNDITTFASSVSFTSDGRKYVIIDEADNLNASTVQPALRNFMEEYAVNCGFVLTCNFPNKIIYALRSRCAMIEFSIPADESQKLAARFMKRFVQILESENVEYDKAVVAEFINRFFPDWRRALNEMQARAIGGKLGTDALGDSDVNLIELFDHMRKKDYTAVRRWIGESSLDDSQRVFRKIYDLGAEFFRPEAIPQLVLIISKYQYQSAFAVDQQINMAACMAEIMMDCAWK